jgi:hypothetical protein
VPTYGLSDNEKTLTLDHIARIAVRHSTMVEVGRTHCRSEAWVNRPLESQHTKSALVHAAEWRVSNEALQPVDAQCELACGQRPESGPRCQIVGRDQRLHTAGPEPCQVRVWSTQPSWPAHVRCFPKASRDIVDADFGEMHPAMPELSLVMESLEMRAIPWGVLPTLRRAGVWRGSCEIRARPISDLGPRASCQI